MNSALGLLYLLLCVAAGHWNREKGHRFWTGFVLALFFTPIVGLIVVACTRPNQIVLEKRALEAGEAKRCPKCAELIKPEAIKCRYCGASV